MRPICSFARVADDGRILCTKIAQGDNEVSPALCLACPARQCKCDHLRSSLVKISSSPITFRCNGHIEVWDDEPPRVAFLRAACAARIAPLSSPQECLNCELKTTSPGEKRGEYMATVKGRAASLRPAHAA
jgi:hypothetical protein